MEPQTWEPSLATLSHYTPPILSSYLQSGAASLGSGKDQMSIPRTVPETGEGSECGSPFWFGREEIRGITFLATLF